MDRRTYIGAFAGCAGLGSVALGGWYSSGASESASPPEDARREVSVVDSELDPSDAPVSFDVTVEDPWITSSSTATLKATTVNDADDERQIQPAYYKGASSTAGDPGIVVYHQDAGDFDVESYSSPCFSGDESPVSTRERDGDDELMFTAEANLGAVLGSGESRTERLIVADDPTVDGCFPPGTYEFEARHTLAGDTISWHWGIVVETVE